VLRNGEGKYTYTIAVTFKDQGHFYPESVSVPDGFTRVADYHTHRHNTREEKEGFSVGDEGHANRRNNLTSRE
jgi:hypothetical protein